MYLKTKLAKGNVADKAGPLNGVGYGVQVQVDSVNFSTENRALCFATSGAPLNSATFTFAAGTTILRPEDGAWDPSNPADFYFVTTDHINNIEAGGTRVIIQEDSGNSSRHARNGHGSSETCRLITQSQKNL